LATQKLQQMGVCCRSGPQLFRSFFVGLIATAPTATTVSFVPNFLFYPSYFLLSPAAASVRTRASALRWLCRFRRAATAVPCRRSHPKCPRSARKRATERLTNWLMIRACSRQGESAYRRPESNLSTHYPLTALAVLLRCELKVDLTKYKRRRVGSCRNGSEKPSHQHTVRPMKYV
jgi:hypothetical protein